nr:hypothetical protein [Tanacetum cinerariifolium]
MIDELDWDEGVALMDDEGAKKKEDEPEVHEVVEVVTTAKLITEVVAAVSESVSVASAIIAHVPAATITAAPSKEQIEEEENRAIKSINETPAQKAAKRRKLNEEVIDLKQNLEIVPDEDDDVYIEATLLARKVPVVDYQIIQEDLESLWSLVKERFSTLKPNNFSDDYLLTTLRAMFGRPDGQDQVWKSQRSVHGQAKCKKQTMVANSIIEAEYVAASNCYG